MRTSEEAEANRAMQSEALPPEPWTSGIEQVEMVRRVVQKRLQEQIDADRFAQAFSQEEADA